MNRWLRNGSRSLLATADVLLAGAAALGLGGCGSSAAPHVSTAVHYNLIQPYTQQPGKSQATANQPRRVIEPSVAAKSAQWSHVSGQVVLDQSTVRAGAKLRGEVVFTSALDHPVVLATGCKSAVQAQSSEPLYGVELSSPRFSNELVSDLVGCSPPALQLVLYPGRNVLRFTAATTAYMCLAPGGKSLIPMLTCDSDRSMPLLPPGRYTANLELEGKLPFTVHGASVTLTH